MYVARRDGSFVTGPETYYVNSAAQAAGIGTPYDADDMNINYADNKEVTNDYTTYNLGLG